MSFNSASKEHSSTGGKTMAKSLFSTINNYPSNEAYNVITPVTMARPDNRGGQFLYNHGGPMPDLIKISKERPRVSNSDKQLKPARNDSEKSAPQKDSTIIGVTANNSKENISNCQLDSRTSYQSKTFTDNSVDSSNRKSSIEFFPFKYEPIEKVTKTTESGNFHKTTDSNAASDSNLTTKSKSSKSKHSRKHSSNASRESDRTLKDNINLSSKSMKSNKLVQRAIERSKNDMGILKRRDDIPPIIIPKELHGIKDLDCSNNDCSDGERSFMPKRVQRLLSSGSEGTDEEQRKKQIAEINNLALAASAAVSNESLNNIDTSKKSASSKSKKRKKNHDDTSTNSTNATSNDQSNIEDTYSNKIPKIDQNSNENRGQLQCSFVDGLNGRCNNMGKNIYCKKHEKIVREVESAFDNLGDDVIGLTPKSDILTNTKSKSKKDKSDSSSRKRRGLSIENRDLLLSCLEKIRMLEMQEESFNSKSRIIQTQIHSLNRLRSNFDKQRRGISDEKIRIVDTMKSLLNSWSPLFLEAPITVDNEGFDVVVSNQKVVNNLINQLNETDPKDVVPNDTNTKSNSKLNE